MLGTMVYPRAFCMVQGHKSMGRVQLTVGFPGEDQGWVPVRGGGTTPEFAEGLPCRYLVHHCEVLGWHGGLSVANSRDLKQVRLVGKLKLLGVGFDTPRWLGVIGLGLIGAIVSVLVGLVCVVVLVGMAGKYSAREGGISTTRHLLFHPGWTSNPQIIGFLLCGFCSLVGFGDESGLTCSPIMS
ncbi:hypothetical protein L1987_12877 [Smallanthus sonchifolius]|uniref:Uncharacterized protein n=1 Tax=Smallanthus sonchifolius TaxID=185202 RepID=A0ACB9JH25_9ASTR|nr:hypothetical protein L1987_12877 [Smallanthus sonchifolius]